MPLVRDYKTDDWKQYAKISKNLYRKNKVYSDDTIEVYIIIWLPGHGTKIHNHSENGCILKVLLG